MNISLRENQAPRHATTPATSLMGHAPVADCRARDATLGGQSHFHRTALPLGDSNPCSAKDPVIKTEAEKDVVGPLTTSPRSSVERVHQVEHLTQLLSDVSELSSAQLFVPAGKEQDCLEHQI